jgi:hypothetical protein
MSIDPAHPTEPDTRPTHRFSTFELVLLALFAALIVAANVAFKLPLKMPGHSGLVWMALLVTAGAIVAKSGSVAIVGVFSGGIAALSGMGDKGGLDTMLSYTAAGVGVEVVRLVAGSLSRPLACAIAGLAGNLTKFAAKTVLDLWIGIPAGFVVLGRMYPLLTYAVFGLVGGYLGFLVVDGLRRAGFFAYLAEKR